MYRDISVTNFGRDDYATRSRLLSSAERARMTSFEVDDRNPLVQQALRHRDARIYGSPRQSANWVNPGTYERVGNTGRIRETAAQQVGRMLHGKVGLFETGGVGTAYIGTANLTNSGLGLASHSDERYERLFGRGARQFNYQVTTQDRSIVQQMRQLMNDMEAGRQLRSSADFAVSSPTDRTLSSRLLHMVNDPTDRSALYITSPTLTDTGLVDSLIRRAERGGEVWVGLGGTQEGDKGIQARTYNQLTQAARRGLNIHVGWGKVPDHASRFAKGADFGVGSNRYSKSSLQGVKGVMSTEVTLMARNAEVANNIRASILANFDFQGGSARAGTVPIANLPQRRLDFDRFGFMMPAMVHRMNPGMNQGREWTYILAPQKHFDAQFRQQYAQLSAQYPGEMAFATSAPGRFYTHIYRETYFAGKGHQPTSIPQHVVDAERQLLMPSAGETYSAMMADATAGLLGNGSREFANMAFAQYGNRGPLDSFLVGVGTYFDRKGYQQSMGDWRTGMGSGASMGMPAPEAGTGYADTARTVADFFTAMGTTMGFARVAMKLSEAWAVMGSKVGAYGRTIGDHVQGFGSAIDSRLVSPWTPNAPGARSIWIMNNPVTKGNSTTVQPLRGNQLVVHIARELDDYTQLPSGDWQHRNGVVVTNAQYQQAARSKNGSFAKRAIGSVVQAVGKVANFVFNVASEFYIAQAQAMTHQQRLVLSHEAAHTMDAKRTFAFGTDAHTETKTFTDPAAAYSFAEKVSAGSGVRAEVLPTTQQGRTVFQVQYETGRKATMLDRHKTQFSLFSQHLNDAPVVGWFFKVFNGMPDEDRQAAKALASMSRSERLHAVGALLRGDRSAASQHWSQAMTFKAQARETYHQIYTRQLGEGGMGPGGRLARKGLDAMILGAGLNFVAGQLMQANQLTLKTQIEQERSSNANLGQVQYADFNYLMFQDFSFADLVPRLFTGAMYGLSYAAQWLTGRDASKMLNVPVSIHDQKTGYSAVTSHYEAGTGDFMQAKSFTDSVVGLARYGADVLTAFTRNLAQTAISYRTGTVFRTLSAKQMTGMSMAELARETVAARSRVQSPGDQRDLEDAEFLLNFGRNYAGGKNDSEVTLMRVTGMRTGTLMGVGVGGYFLQSGDKSNLMLSLMAPMPFSGGVSFKMPYYFSAGRARRQMDMWLTGRTTGDSGEDWFRDYVKGKMDDRNENFIKDKLFNTGSWWSLLNPMGYGYEAGSQHEKAMQAIVYAGGAIAGGGPLGMAMGALAFGTGFALAQRGAAHIQYRRAQGAELAALGEKKTGDDKWLLANMPAGSAQLKAAQANNDVAFRAQYDGTVAAQNAGRDAHNRTKFQGMRGYKDRLVHYIKTGEDLAHELNPVAQMYNSLIFNKFLDTRNGWGSNAVGFGMKGVGVGLRTAMRFAELAWLPIALTRIADVGGASVTALYNATVRTIGQPQRRVDYRTSRLAQGIRMSRTVGRAGMWGFLGYTAMAIGSALQETNQGNGAQGYEDQIKSYTQALRVSGSQYGTLLTAMSHGMADYMERITNVRYGETRHRTDGDQNAYSFLQSLVGTEARGNQGQVAPGWKGAFNMAMKAGGEFLSSLRVDALAQTMELTTGNTGVNVSVKQLDKDTVEFSKGVNRIAAGFGNFAFVDYKTMRLHQKGLDLEGKNQLARVIGGSDHWFVRYQMKGRERPAAMGKMFHSMSAAYNLPPALRMALALRWGDTRSILASNPAEYARYQGRFRRGGMTPSRLNKYTQYREASYNEAGALLADNRTGMGIASRTMQVEEKNLEAFARGDLPTSAFFRQLGEQVTGNAALADTGHYSAELDGNVDPFSGGLQSSLYDQIRAPSYGSREDTQLGWLNMSGLFSSNRAQVGGIGGAFLFAGAMGLAAGALVMSNRLRNGYYGSVERMVDRYAPQGGASIRATVLSPQMHDGRFFLADAGTFYEVQVPVLGSDQVLRVGGPHGSPFQDDPNIGALAGATTAQQKANYVARYYNSTLENYKLLNSSMTNMQISSIADEALQGLQEFRAASHQRGFLSNMFGSGRLTAKATRELAAIAALQGTGQAGKGDLRRLERVMRNLLGRYPEHLGLSLVNPSKFVPDTMGGIAQHAGNVVNTIGMQTVEDVGGNAPTPIGSAAQRMGGVYDTASDEGAAAIRSNFAVLRSEFGRRVGGAAWSGIKTGFSKGLKPLLKGLGAIFGISQLSHALIGLSAYAADDNVLSGKTRDKYFEASTSMMLGSALGSAATLSALVPGVGWLASGGLMASAVVVGVAESYAAEKERPFWLPNRVGDALNASNRVGQGWVKSISKTLGSYDWGRQLANTIIKTTDLAQINAFNFISEGQHSSRPRPGQTASWDHKAWNVADLIVNGLGGGLFSPVVSARPEVAAQQRDRSFSLDPYWASKSPIWWGRNMEGSLGGGWLSDAFWYRERPRQEAARLSSSVGGSLSWMISEETLTGEDGGRDITDLSLSNLYQRRAKTGNAFLGSVGTAIGGFMFRGVASPNPTMMAEFKRRAIMTEIGVLGAALRRPYATVSGFSGGHGTEREFGARGRSGRGTAASRGWAAARPEDLVAAARQTFSYLSVGPTPGFSAEAHRQYLAVAKRLSQWNDHFEGAARTHGVPANLLRAIAIQESAGDPRALSLAGAQGLMQFMPETAREFGVNPADPRSAIYGAARYLVAARPQLERAGIFNLQNWAASYNAGVGGAIAGAATRLWETRGYVAGVPRHYAWLDAQQGIVGDPALDRFRDHFIRLAERPGGSTNVQSYDINAMVHEAGRSAGITDEKRLQAYVDNYRSALRNQQVYPVGDDSAYWRRHSAGAVARPVTVEAITVAAMSMMGMRRREAVPDGVEVVRTQGGLQLLTSRGYIRTSGAFNEPRPGHRHAGEDIVMPHGAPLLAQRSGTVVYNAWAKGYGNYLVIDHGQGVFTAYAHMAGTGSAGVGQQVQIGQPVGVQGNTGHSFGDHLHFEVRLGGVSGRVVNPAELNRLLPINMRPDPEYDNTRARLIAELSKTPDMGDTLRSVLPGLAARGGVAGLTRNLLQQGFAFDSVMPRLYPTAPKPKPGLLDSLLNFGLPAPTPDQPASPTAVTPGLGNAGTSVSATLLLGLRPVHETVRAALGLQQHIVNPRVEERGALVAAHGNTPRPAEMEVAAPRQTREELQSISLTQLAERLAEQQAREDARRRGLTAQQTEALVRSQRQEARRTPTRAVQRVVTLPTPSVRPQPRVAPGRAPSAPARTVTTTFTGMAGRVAASQGRAAVVNPGQAGRRRMINEAGLRD